ncbi:mannosyl-oligosaccharide alpha-1,2-mannosidase [Podila epigama]|nr:mannosyl-oligosaccharide alpha-1,2-mannosidase [Podila epigama]
MFKRQENRGPMIPLHANNEDKYSKPLHGRSLGRRWFRVRTIVGILGLLTLGYLTLSPAKKTRSLSDLPALGKKVWTAQPNQAIWDKRNEKVKAAFRHSWEAYKRDAWGKDEYHPISHHGSNMLQNGQGYGFTIVDSLDTILLMGLDKEFKEARDWVEHSLNFNQDGTVNLFETTIRVLGGLLAAYDQSGAKEKVFLDKAVDLADRLLGAFNTPTGIPYASVHLSMSRGVPGHEGGRSSTSEVSTLQLEFKYLSYLTGDDKYWKAAEKVMFRMRKMKDLDGLVPIYINPVTAEYYGSEIRLGSRGDSFYEYLIKQYLQTNKQEPIYKQMYDRAIAGVKKHLIGWTAVNNLLFIGEITTYSPQVLSPKMDHLVCFLGGTMALASTEGHTLDKDLFPRSKFTALEEEDFRIGEELTRSCYEMYRQTETGLAAEIVYWVARLDETTSRSPPEYFEGSDFMIHNRDGHNWLRPETVESLFYLWRLTKEEKYREWGWQIFEAIEKYSKVESGGYSSIHDIRKKDAIEYSDKMETFFLAETLKYLYLLFGPDDVLPLDKYVFNTEAHALPIFTPPAKFLVRSQNIDAWEREEAKEAEAQAMAVEGRDTILETHEKVPHQQHSGVESASAAVLFEEQIVADEVDQALEEISVDDAGELTEDTSEVEVEYEDAFDGSAGEGERD